MYISFYKYITFYLEKKINKITLFPNKISQHTQCNKSNLDIGLLGLLRIHTKPTLHF